MFCKRNVKIMGGVLKYMEGKITPRATVPVPDRSSERCIGSASRKLHSATTLTEQSSDRCYPQISLIFPFGKNPVIKASASLLQIIAVLSVPM
jgi:hypothetical protein